MSATRPADTSRRAGVTAPSSAATPATPTAIDVVERYLELISAARFDDLADLYSEEAVVEHPFNPPSERWLRGRAALARRFARLAALGLDMRVEDLLMHSTADPQTVISEFTYRGRAGDRPVYRRNVFVTTVRDGRIVRSRDYQAEVDPGDQQR